MAVGWTGLPGQRQQLLELWQCDEQPDDGRRGGACLWSRDLVAISGLIQL
jgi:hypothetical protein